jgi:outer membrane autotransporter protein
LRNVSFEGAIVDTSNIDFYKEMYIEADQTTTLVSNFGGTPKEFKGSKYMVGTAFDGEGSATMENGSLIFRTKTAAGVSEQTHKAVMGVEATMGLLATGKEHAGNVLDGLGNLSNVGSDGASVAASFGGGKDRYETGSHVNINSWSAAVGVGARKETKKGTLQYGIFGEYGKGNYTMHSDVGRSDGDAHYAGGGLMAKWTNKHDVYTEASFRLGRVSDSANDLLRDGAGNAYGYDIHATYYGAHIGLGKVFNYKGGKSLDVYGKFFYTKRDGAEFDAKQHYNLDSVNSSVLRIGARYGTTDKKWNWYGGLAYEYEFDGEAKGTVNGTEIRAASIKGSSVRGELGMKMSATKDNPWQADISIYGYGGKHRGFGGSVSVAYTF